MTYPREPNPGDKISAQLIRDIIRCLRRITPLAGHGVKRDVTPNGTRISAEGSGGGSSEHSDKGCWMIAAKLENGEVKLVFENKYYAIGGYVFSYPDDVYLDSFIMQGNWDEREEGSEWTEEDKPMVALKVSMEPYTFGEPTVVGYKDFAEMSAELLDPLYFIKPLYLLTHFGKVKFDYRNMPLIPAGENVYGNYPGYPVT